MLVQSAALAFMLALQPTGTRLPDPPATPAAPTEESKADEIKTLDDLLNALERADAGMRTLQGGIYYDRVFEIQGDRQIRRGKIYFEDTPAAGDKPRARKFGVRLDSLQVGKRLEPEVKEVIFDGQWLVEILPARKQFSKTQIVPTGESFDPLKVGEGPFPLPIGQKKADMLARYDVTMPPAYEGVISNDDENEEETAELKKFVKEAYQIKLVPKAALLPKEELHEIRLWYTRTETGALLPRMARTVNRAGDISIVKLTGVELNKPLPPGVLETATPGAGWDVNVRELPGTPGGRKPDSR